MAKKKKAKTGDVEDLLRDAQDNEPENGPINKPFLAAASIEDFDLYHTESILVSSVWNKNDDVFTKEEIWNARKTPIDKRDNINHDENEIVGHTVDAWAIDNSGEVLPDDTKLEDLPDLFHIVTSSVIYKAWEDKENKDKVATLIDEIEGGTKFVSMECLFSNFDYAVQKSTGEQMIIPRNADTSFLTKYLRSYGGDGEYKGMKIGRIPRNIVFSGKGYVDKPANPSSLILSAGGEDFIFMPNSGVSNVSSGSEMSITDDNKEIEQMPDKDLRDDQIVELKAQNKALADEIKALQETVTKASSKEVEAKIAELQSALDGAKSSLEKSAADLNTANETIKSTKADLDKVSAEKAELATKLEEINASVIKANRISTLVAGGIDKAEAEQTVEKFAALSDEQFAAVAELAIAAKKPGQDCPDDMKGKKGKGKGEATEEGKTAEAATTELNEVQTEDVALSAASETNGSTVETARAALATIIGNRIKVKNVK